MARADSTRFSEPRRSHGCLWTILGILFIAVIAGAGAFYYGSWFIQSGYRNDPALQTAMAKVRDNRIAQDVLGGGIVVESMESEIFSATTGKGKTVTYALHVRGDKGEGELHIMLHSSGQKMKIVSMVLTGPDEQRYNLTGLATAPPSNSI